MSKAEDDLSIEILLSHIRLINKKTLTELANETYEHYCQRMQTGATPFTNYEILTKESYKSYIKYIKRELAKYD